MPHLQRIKGLTRHFLLDATASPVTPVSQSVSGSVIDSFRLEITIASPRFASLLVSYRSNVSEERNMLGPGLSCSGLVESGLSVLPSVVRPDGLGSRHLFTGWLPPKWLRGDMNKQGNC